MAPREKSNVNFTLLKSMIDTFKDSYDYIILDCPPVSNNADTLMLSNITRDVVLVANYQHISYKVIEKSMQRLTQIDSKILGIIVNSVPQKKIL